MHLLGKNCFLLGAMLLDARTRKRSDGWPAAFILAWRLKSLIILIDHSDAALSGARAFLAKGLRA
jgi:hypothetical protein